MNKILIVDDDAEFRSHLIEILNESGYLTESAASAKEAFKHLRAQEFDVVLLDYMMPKQTGIDAIAEIKRLRPKTKVVMITAFASVEKAIDAIRKGGSDYISKPFKIEDLLTTIRRVLEEAKFEAFLNKLDSDHPLHSLINPIRRNILKLLQSREKMRLMEIAQELGIADHTKVVFHMKLLREAGLIERDSEKFYCLTKEGMKSIDCLRALETNFVP